MAILPKTIQALPNIKIEGAFDSPITGVSIDTRSLSAGDLFVAFKGSQVDGHDFIPKAISRGASAVMASTSWDGCEHWEAPIPLILSEDPVKSLAELATAHRKRFVIPVIAITGTNGKTSTKNMLSHLLKKRFNVLTTVGNFNNHIGLPITILNMDESHEIAVIEMGASQQGDIEYLCEIAQPTQGLITNISLAHTEFFKDIETIQRTKGELFKYLCTHGGRSFVNLDDNRVNSLGQPCPNPIHYSFLEDAEYNYSSIGPDAKGCYSLQFESYSAQLPIPGKVVALNAAVAATVALQNGLRYDQVQEALEAYGGEDGRMTELLINSVHFFNDAYNANPASVKAGLATIADMPCTGSKRLVFADMLELGPDSESLHRAAADQMIQAGFDHIYLVGNEVSAVADRLSDAGFSSLFYSKDKSEVIEQVLADLVPEDLVYLKGSRSMQLETFIQAYKENN